MAMIPASLGGWGSTLDPSQIYLSISLLNLKQVFEMLSFSLKICKEEI